MRKKTLSAFLGLVLGASTILGSIGANPVPVSAGTDGITDSECTTTGTAEPASDEVVPDANQYKYQKDELAAFCHFGPNTFNEIEWGEHYGNKAPNEIFTLKDNFDADTLVSTLKNAGFKKIIVTARSMQVNKLLKMIVNHSIRSEPVVKMRRKQYGMKKGNRENPVIFKHNSGKHIRIKMNMLEFAV